MTASNNTTSTTTGSSGSNSITNNSNMSHHSKMNSSSYSHSNNNNNNNNQQHYYHHNNPHHNNRDDSFKSLFNNNNNSPSSLRNNHFSNRFNTSRNTSTSTTTNGGNNNSSTHTKTTNNNNNNNNNTATTPVMLYDEEGWPLTSSPYHYSSTTTIVASSSTPNHKNINNNNNNNNNNIPKATTATPPPTNNKNNTTHNITNNNNSRGGFFVVNNNNSSSQASIRRSMLASPPPSSSTQHKPSLTAASSSSVTTSHTTPTATTTTTTTTKTTTVNSVSSSSSLIIGKGSPMLVCHYRTKKQYVHNTNHVNSQTNLYQFLKFTTPLLHRSQFQSKLSPSISSDPDNITPTATGLDQNSGSNSSNSAQSNSFYYLRDLWSFYDEPYGIDVPVVLDGRQEHVYFVPHLSAIQLFKKRTASSHTKNHNNNNNNKEDLLLFEYFETSSPDLRYPLIDKIEELAQRQSLLLDGTIMQLDATRSWYSIAWYPILCHSQTIPWLKGQMITYHNFIPSVNHLIDPVFCDDEFKQEFLCGRSLVKKADHHSTENVSTRSLNNEQASTSTSSTTSDGADGTDTAYEHTYAAPVIGFLPYKVKNETWFANYQDSSSVHNEADFYAPLHLVRACKRVLAKAGVKHPDFEHCVQNCSDLGLI